MTPLELQILAKAERYCAREEQCRWSVQQKLIAWGTPKESVDAIIDQLTDEGFINEQRYVQSFCVSKLRLQKWGRHKVAYQLRTKHIPNELITEGLSLVTEEEYQDILLSVARTKWAGYPSDDPHRRDRLSAFLFSRGYETDDIRWVCKQLAEDKTTNEED